MIGVDSSPEMLARAATEAPGIAWQQADVATWARAGVPWIVLRAGGLFVPMWREVHEMSYLWFTPHRLDDAKFQVAAGPFAYTPERDAIRTALAELNLLGAGKAAA